MTKSELKEYILETVGPNYASYPACVEWNLKVLHYLQERKDKLGSVTEEADGTDF